MTEEMAVRSQARYDARASSRLSRYYVAGRLGTAPASYRGPFPLRELKRLEQGESERFPLWIDEVGIAEQYVELALFQRVDHALDPVRVPDVILVAEENELAVAGTHGLLEVRGDPEGPRISENRESDGNRKPGGSCREFGDDVERCIHGSVIGHDDLGHGSSLLENALKLLREIRRSVVGAERDRHGDRGAAR